MSPTERAALMALLAQMRDTYDEFSELHAGISVLHLDAAIAALESRLRTPGDRSEDPGRGRAPLEATH